MKTYAEKLLDPRWQKRKSEILRAAQFRCEDCGRDDLTLHVHHCAYMTGKEPWEYDNSLLMSVCPKHHKERQELEDALRVEMGRITRFLSIDRLRDEAFRLVREMADRETARLAASFS